MKIKGKRYDFKIEAIDPRYGLEEVRKYTLKEVEDFLQLHLNVHTTENLKGEEVATFFGLYRGFMKS